MREKIRVTIPIIYKTEYSKKSKNRPKSKNYRLNAISFNWYLNLSPFKRNDIKKYFEDLIIKQLEGYELSNKGAYRITLYFYYHKNNIDTFNVISMVVKFLEDALQYAGVTKGDDVKYGKEYHIYTQEEDKVDPRVEAVITFLDEEDEW